ncbi:hypothetical protein [Pontibacter indicus]|uniref:hypothetical protein n=1 Tax=Pontibacter indicus TaxID=1317125 RepID=UPI00147B28C9|nr:hypothetical protein [Pontibacter indicus]
MKRNNKEEQHSPTRFIPNASANSLAQGIHKPLYPVKIMKVEVLQIDWFLGKEPAEGTITVKAKDGSPISAFAYEEEFTEGEVVNVEFDSINDDLDWNTIFGENKNQEKKLVKSINDWEYEGYGQIKSIEPVVIDFGDIELETGKWTSDKKVVGEFVYWKINRLDIIKIE